MTAKEKAALGWLTGVLVSYRKFSEREITYLGTLMRLIKKLSKKS